MFWSGLAKFLLGFSLAIALLAGGGVAAAMYFMSKASIRPNKPIFTNDKPTVKVQHKPNNITARTTTLPTAQPSSPKPLSGINIQSTGKLATRHEPTIRTQSSC